MDVEASAKRVGEDQILPRLTFGVEIEFALATVLHKEASGRGKNEEDPDPSDPRSVFGLTTGVHSKEADNVRENIAKTLREQAGVVANTSIGTLDSPRVEAWVIDTDVTITVPDDKYLYHKIEIKSPPYYFSPEALMTVKQVCQVLSQNYRISCKRSGALHVHGGNGFDGFLVETVRLFMATIWTYEPILEKLHPENRRKND